MKLYFRTILVICSIFTGAFFLAGCSDDSAQSTDNLLDVIEKAQKTIYQKYPDESSIARKMAIEELEKIARSDKSDEDKICAIHAKFPDQATEMKKVAEQGDANAQFELGLYYGNGNGGKIDHFEAVKWFRKAAEQGHAEAQYRLGIYYDLGAGTGKDETEAAKWFRKAAEQGHAEAQFYLGRGYYNGQGVSKDEAEAVKWFHKAAEQGQASAQLNLGYIYCLGQGVNQDEAEAVKWFRKAAEQGDEEAKDALKRLGY